MNKAFVDGSISGFCTGLLTVAVIISLSREIPPAIYPKPPVPFDHALPVIRTKLPPMDITLRIVPREEFEKRYINTAGITQWATRPCVIEIPSDWVVRFAPRMGYAHFMDEDNSNTLAHEILHCVHGPWHPAWSDILAKEKEDAKGSSGILTIVPNSGAR